jgi:DNA-binding winged helix-turn-helix (wHTH) protein/TolB-like protein/tetratricopeptide (TPR) repeat protein
MSDSETHLYEFGPFRLDPKEHLLLRSGEPVHLMPKVFDTLVVLVSRHGHLVEKDTLLSKIWPETNVEEGNLTQNVSILRKALDQAADGREYIETVPKQGYRFVGPVTVVKRELVAPRRAEQGEEQVTPGEEPKVVAGSPGGLSVGVTPPAPAGNKRKLTRRVWMLAAVALLATAFTWLFVWFNSRPAEVRSIAVLPFDSNNLSDGRKDEFEGRAMAEVLTNRLSSQEKIIVRQTGAIQQYKGSPDPSTAGRELGVDAVLTGSIQHDGGRVRVTMQLVRVRDGVSLWAEKFDVAFTNHFEVQDVVSVRVAERLMPKLSGEEEKRLTKHTTNIREAQQAYVEGRVSWSKRTVHGLEEGSKHFQRAIALDPNYALAHAGLADCYALLGVYMARPPRASFPKAKAAVEKSLVFDPELAEAYASRGAIKFFYEWDWEGAEYDFKSATRLNASYPHAYQWNGLRLAALGKFDDAINDMTRAQELEPNSLIISTNIGWIYYFARRYGLAIEQLKKTTRLDPNFPRAHLRLGMAYEVNGMHQEAIAEYEKTLDLGGRDPYVMGLLGYALAKLGSRDKATGLLRELQELKLQQQVYVSPYSIAMINAGLGNNDAAFAALNEALSDRSGMMIYLKVDPMLDSLRSDSRFASYVERLELGGANNP